MQVFVHCFVAQGEGGGFLRGGERRVEVGEEAGEAHAHFEGVDVGVCHFDCIVAMGLLLYCEEERLFGGLGADLVCSYRAG